MGKYLVTCLIVILVILLQTDVIISLSRKGSSRPSGGGSRGSHHKPSRPVHQPSKPSRPVHQPSKPSRPVHQPSKPVHQPIKPIHQPVKPAQNPIKPVKEVPVQSAHQPVHPVQNPAPPQNNPIKPAQNPAYPPQNPGYPQHNPAYPPQNPGQPQHNPAYPPQNPGQPQHNPAYPPQNPGYPQHNPAYPPQNPGYPQHNPAYPPQNPGQPQHNPAYPPQNPGQPQHNPAYPPQNPGQPQHNPAYPPQNPGYPQHNPAHPPQNPGYPQHNPAYPPQNPGQPQHNPAYPPQNPGYPQHNPAYPPQNPGYPQHNPAHPPQNPGYPQHNPAYPPQNPGYPQHNPGYPHNPNYPPKPAYPQHNPGYPHNPHWGQYDVKPWKPKPPKTKLKYMVGAAAAGAVGGFLLGRAMSNMHFHFRNPEEERWWYANRDRYPDRVYYPRYDQPIPEDVFVRDCWNITVREFIEPSGNETADEMETRVVTRVVQEMCIQQYRSFSGNAEGGSITHSNSDPQKSNPSKPVLKQVEGEAVAGTAVEDSGAILGSPMANMHFQFNNSEEEQWWNENRHRFMEYVFHPNYSQPVPMDVFVSDCINVTMGEYFKPNGNETANETETRVLKRLVPEICTEVYHSYSRHREGDRFGNSDKKPEELIMPIKFVMEDMAVAPTRRAAAKGSGSHIPNSAMSNVHFHFIDALLLTSPSMLLVTVLSTCFLIP